MLTEEKNKLFNRIFIPEGEAAGGCWHLMRATFELAKVPLVNPFKEAAPLVKDSSFLNTTDSPPLGYTQRENDVKQVETQHYQMLHAAPM